MIYNNDFIWLHFPKCAGTKIEVMFAKYFADDNSIHQDRIKQDIFGQTPWHDDIGKRKKTNPKFDVGNRTIICCFRKLMPWLASKYLFEKNRSPNLPHCKKMLLKAQTFEQNGNISNSEMYAKKFLPEVLFDLYKVEIIRIENFEKDFKNIFSKYIDIDKIPDTEFKKKENEGKSEGKKILNDYLSDNEEQIYNSSPYWSLLEQNFYSK